MNNFKRQNTRSSKIKNNFSRDIDNDNKKNFLLNLFLLIIGIGFIIYLLIPKGSKDPYPKPIIVDSASKPQSEPTPVAKVDNRKTIQITSISPNVDAVNGNFKASFVNRSRDIQSINSSDSLFDFESFHISYEDNKIITKLNVKPGNQGFSKFTVVLNPVGKARESLNNTLLKNEGSMRINTQSLNGFEYHLVGIKSNAKLMN